MANSVTNLISRCKARSTCGCWASNKSLFPIEPPHDYKLALTERRTIAELYRGLVAADPNNYAYAHQQRSNLFSTGELFEAMGDYTSVGDFYRQALQLAEKLTSVKANLDSSVLINDFVPPFRSWPCARAAMTKRNAK